MKLPKGWYRVRVGCKVKPGDRCYDYEMRDYQTMRALDCYIPVREPEVMCRRKRRKP